MTKKQAKKPSAAKQIAKPYTPTPEELAVLKPWAAEGRALTLAPGLKVETKDGGQKVSAAHADPNTGFSLIMASLNVQDVSFMEGFIKQLVNACTIGPQIDELSMNFMLATIRGIKPQDQAELMLAAQMAAVHNATMTFARRLNHVENIQQQDSAERAFNKLARTFAAQVEALRKYRNGGEQRVVVEHVTVNEGGQAIVGTVAGGRVPLANGG